MARKKVKKMQKSTRNESVPLLKLFPLGLKLFFSYLKFKKKAQKAEKVFRKELKAQNLNSDISKKLTTHYMESSHIFKNMPISNFRKLYSKLNITGFLIILINIKFNNKLL